MRKVASVLLVAVIGAGAAWAAAVAVHKPSVYQDGLYGFSLQGPAFPAAEKGSNVTPVMLLGPAQNGFAGNVNVMVQQVAVTRDAYRKISTDGFKAAGFKVNADRNMTVSGKDAILFDYEGTQQGLQLRFLALAVIDKERVFVVTGTALKDSFPEKEFMACLNSFRLGA